MVKRQGGKQVIGAVGGIEIPAVNDYIVGYKYCAQKSEPSIKVLVGYSNSFIAEDACKTVAQNQIGQGSQVEFQVAGGCGLGALNAAAQAGKWGIGVDVDQYKLANNVLTSAIKRVDIGIYDAIEAGQGRQVQGRHRRALQPEQQRRRRRHDQPEGAGEVHHRDEQDQGEDHHRQAQRPDDAGRSSRTGRGAGPTSGARPPPFASA